VEDTGKKIVNGFEQASMFYNFCILNLSFNATWGGFHPSRLSQASNMGFISFQTEVISSAIIGTFHFKGKAKFPPCDWNETQASGHF
jgi:hypothetical protein